MGGVMKPQILLDCAKLRHYRVRGEKSWTQKQVAQALAKTGKPVATTGKPGKSEKSLLPMYQAIERTGKTSPVRAAAIAEFLGVFLDDLTPGETDEKIKGGTWWFEPPYPHNTLCKGMLLASAFNVLDQIAREFKNTPKPSSDIEKIMSLTRLGQEWHLAYTREDRPDASWSCAFRPARKTDERGIGWMSASDLELGLFEPALIAFIFSNADVAILNGKRIPPDDADLGVHVEFRSDIPGRTPLCSSSGTRVYPNERLFLISMLNHMREHDDWKVSTTDAMIHMPPQIEVRRMPIDRTKPDYFCSSIYTISHVWRDTDGTWQHEPWPRNEREELVQIIEKRTSRILRHEDEEIPPFAPDTDP
jgi:hypothetical protein